VSEASGVPLRSGAAALLTNLSAS